MSRKRILALAAVVGVVLFVLPAGAQTTWCVDDDAPFGGDGTSWEAAYRCLQDAIASAAPGDEIRVAGGTYRPDRDEAGNVTLADRTAAFQLVDSVALYGGYRGCPDSQCAAGDPNERNVSAYESILSGDLSADDNSGYAGPGADCCEAHFGPGCRNAECDAAVSESWPYCHDQWDFFCANLAMDLCCELCAVNVRTCENAYHVIWASGSTEATILDGFTVSDGKAYGRGPGFYGAGMVAYQASPTIVNCTSTHHTGFYGAGLYIEGGAPTVSDSTFGENSASHGGGVRSWFSSPVFNNCSFRRNRAHSSAGALYSLNGHLQFNQCTFEENAATQDAEFAPGTGGGLTIAGDTALAEFVDCTFRQNEADTVGGAVFVSYDTRITFENCLFAGNTAADRGGALYSRERSVTGMSNCTLLGNVAPNGGALFNHQSTRTLENCIVWGNRSDQISGFESVGAVAYSNVEGGWIGDANIDDDPMFVLGPAGCYYLSQIVAGQPTDSPCIDTGRNTAANLGLDTLTTRSDEGVDAGIVDMGYHYPVMGQSLVMGDYDRDLDVDLADFAAFQNCFTAEGPADVSPCCRIFDFEPDSDVDVYDYAAFESALSE